MQNPTIPEYSISIVCYYIAYIILITKDVFTYLLFKDVTCMRLYIKNWNCTFLLRSCKTFRGQFTVTKNASLCRPRQSRTEVKDLPRIEGLCYDKKLRATIFLHTAFPSANDRYAFSAVLVPVEFDKKFLRLLLFR